MNAYELQCYKDGLAGNKPLIDLGLGTGGYQAQAQGYADYLKNKDLARQVADSNSEFNADRYTDSTPYKPPETKPATTERILRNMLYLDTLVMWFLIPIVGLAITLFCGLFFAFFGLDVWYMTHFKYFYLFSCIAFYIGSSNAWRLLIKEDEREPY